MPSIWFATFASPLRNQAPTKDIPLLLRDNISLALLQFPAVLELLGQLIFATICGPNATGTAFDLPQPRVTFGFGYL